MAGKIPRSIGRLSRSAWPAALALAIAALAVSAPASGQTKAELNISSTQTYVHVPQLLELRVHNCSRCESPVIPDVAGCEIRYNSGPSRYESHSFSGGQSTSVSYINYGYSLTPTTVGELVIPPFTVVADGKEYRTEPLRLKVRDLPEGGATRDAENPGDLVTAEITCRQDRLYAGQHADLDVTLWIKPAKIGTRDVQISDMINITTITPDPRKYEGCETNRVPRRLPDGSVQMYYTLTFPIAKVVDQPGPVDFGDVRFRIGYPVIGRDMFGDPTVARRTELLVRPTVTIPDVLPLPTENRPDNFSGAVGRYRINVIALPTNVRIGDPIELTITITGDPVEPLRQPDLSLVPGLADDFRIADSDLAGIVSGDDKRFKQTIRAKRTDVKEIPPLEFCYFDPIKERYEIARTEPVPLLVRAVERLDASDLGGISAETPETPATQLEVRDGLRGLKTDESELLAQAPTITQSQVWTVTLAGPLIFCAAWGAMTLVSAKRNERTQRKRRALRSAEQRIRDARGDQLSAAEFHGQIESALAGYLADRLDQPPARFLGADASTQLRARGINEELVERYAELLRRCQEAAYAGGGAGDPSLADTAQRCIQDLERERL